MRGFNFNISSLFGGMGSNNPFSGINISDYASIRNGSYRKLTKNYYGVQKKEAAPEKKIDKTTDKPKKEVADTTGLTQMKKEADGMKSAAAALGKDSLWKKTDGEYDMEKITSAVKSFANEYNDVISQSAKVNSRDIAQSVRYMNSMTHTMSKALSKIGVTVGADGKMAVNEDTLQGADVNTIKSLFYGSASYGAQMTSRAAEISKEAVMNSSTYSSNGTLSSALGSMFSQWM